MRLIRSAQEVHEANDVRYATIHVPEWGDEDTYIRIRSFSANELMRFTSLKGKSEKESIARGLMMCAVDENGDRIFSEADVKPLMSKSVAVLNRCQQAILELNEIGGRKRTDDEEEDEGMSDLEREVKD